jgi:predicted ATPase
MMLAYWGPAYLLVQMGEFLSARSNVEKALQVYDPLKHQRLITIFTLDMGVSCLSWLSFALFFLGYPDQALKRSGEAITLARQIGHPFSLAFALSVASILRGCALDAQGSQELAEEAIAICSEKGFLYWLGVATVYRGLGLAWQGKYDEGISQTREGERIWRATGAVIGQPEYLISLAEVLGDAGEAEKGLRMLQEVFEMINRSGETIYAEELHRIRGDLLLKLSLEDQGEAEACYRKAIAIAHKQQAKILELRATTSLSRLLLGQGRRDEARELLQNIYNWFTEGFETRDLRTALVLLEELS